MAIKTPSTVVTENFGSNTLYKASFADIDTGDTYATYLTSAVAYWCNGTDVPASGVQGIDVRYSVDTDNVIPSGIFTFSTGEANRTGDLYILLKS